MKYFLLCLSVFITFIVSAQNKKNYLLEINGDTVSLSLNEPSILKTANGQTLNIKLKQKEILTYSDEMVSFQYPSAFTLSSKVYEDVEQIVCLSGSGNGFLIQKYKDINPENMVDLMLSEMIEESIDAGYKEKKIPVEKTLKSNKTLSGKQSTLTLDDETNIYSVFPVKIKKGGLIIVLVIVDPSDEADMKAYDVLWKTLEPKN